MVTHTSVRMPQRLFVLSACVFTLGMSEFMIAGLLGPMSKAFHRSEPTTALLVTAFAFAIVISAPITAALTVRLRPKSALVTSMLVFVASHVLTALIPVFGVALLLRLASGTACATFLSIAAVAGVRMVDESRAPRAIAVMVGGLTLSNVAGLPIAAWIGVTCGWTAAFWLVAVLATVACVVLIRTRIEPAPPVQDVGLRAQLAVEARVLTRWPMVITFAIVVLFQAAMFATFTYLQPLVTRVGRVTESATGALMAIFGVGTLIGVAIGGAVAHRGLLRNMAVSLLATVVTLLLLIGAIRQPLLLIGLITLVFGIATFSICAALNGRVFALAGDAPTLASGMNIAMLNLGNAAGPAIAGLLISTHHNQFLIAPWSSIAFAGCALVLVAVARTADRHLARRPTDAGQHS